MSLPDNRGRTTSPEKCHPAPTRSRVAIAATIKKDTPGEFLFLYFRPCSARYFLSFSWCTTVRWVLIFSQLGPSRGYQRRMTAHVSSRIAGTRNHARTMPASAEALVPQEAPPSRDIGSRDRGRSGKNLVVLIGAGIQEARLRMWMAQRPVRETRHLRSLEDLPHAQVPENTVRVLLMRRR
jgi:hypothetical protein